MLVMLPSQPVKQINLMSVFLLILSSSCLLSTQSRVYMDTHGGYKGVVVRIDDDIEQDNCKEIIDNVKVNHFDCKNQQYLSISSFCTDLFFYFFDGYFVLCLESNSSRLKNHELSWFIHIKSK